MTHGIGRRTLRTIALRGCQKYPHPASLWCEPVYSSKKDWCSPCLARAALGMICTRDLRIGDTVYADKWVSIVDLEMDDDGSVAANASDGRRIVYPPGEIVEMMRPVELVESGK